MEEEIREQRLCVGTFFNLFLRAKKRSVSQPKCFQRLFIPYDAGLKDLAGNSLESIVSRFKKCDKTLNSEYIRFGNDILNIGLQNKLKKEYSDVLWALAGEIEEMINEDSIEWFARALLELLLADDSISDNTKFYIYPKRSPVYKREIVNIKKIYFYDFVLGIWEYVCCNCEDNGIGESTYMGWTEPAGNSRERKFISKIGIDKYRDVEVTTSLEWEKEDTAEDEYDEFEEDTSYVPLVDGNGIAPDLGKFNPEDILYVQEGYRKRTKGRYGKYVDNAKEKHYMKKTFLYEVRKPFYDFFVCNDIKIRGMGSVMMGGFSNEALIIKNASPSSFVVGRNNVILSGTGGLGKSMMMTHFMLTALDDYERFGTVPIFVQLRNYNPTKMDLIDFVFAEFHRHDIDLTLLDLVNLLSKGKALILMDGLDEIASSYQEQFNQEIEMLTDNYPEAKYFISSRPSSNFHSYSRFQVYDLQPFSLEQAIEMVTKLDERVIEAGIQEDFVNDLKSNRFKLSYSERIDFLGNPLFLTIMLITYENFHDIPTQRYLFYEKAYEAMAQKHDAYKSLTRDFKTGLDERKFQYCFGEFCAITYEAELYEFTRQELIDYFQEVIYAEDLNTTAEAFIEDITGKVCLIYLDGDKYYFVHRSFQEYFAAYFFSKQLEQNFDAVLEMLMCRDETSHDSMMLPMLYGMEPKKTELCIFLPFLKNIFEKETDNLYREFLCTLYPCIVFEQGTTNDFFENDSESSIYKFFAEVYDLHEIILGDKLPEDREHTTWEYGIYNKNWDKPLLKAEYDIIRIVDLPSEYVEHEGEVPDVVGWAVQYEPLHIYESKYDQHTVQLLESEDFPLKKEFNAAKKKYEELRDSYTKRPKKSFISRFH